MTVESLKTFCDLVETASFARAARLNFVTQAAVSQQLRTLERHYDCRLIDRGPRRDLRLTDAGKVLYAEAKAALERLTVAEQRLRHRPDVGTGPVTIASVTSVGLHTLPGPMKAFLRAYPQVTLRLLYRRTDEIYLACLERIVDLGIVAIPARPAGRRRHRHGAGQHRDHQALRRGGAGRVDPSPPGAGERDQGGHPGGAPAGAGRLAAPDRDHLSQAGKRARDVRRRARLS